MSRRILTLAALAIVISPQTDHLSSAPISGTSTATVRACAPTNDCGEWLYNVGFTLNCYFTIEETTREIEGSCNLTERPFRGAACDSVEEVIAHLAKQLPDYKVVRDRAVPAVVHLIDRNLLSRKNYPLDRPQSIDFRGNLTGLLVALHDIDPAVGPRTVFSIGVDRGPFDILTPTRISAKDLPVRDILTRAVPLKGYRTVLWVAKTFPEGEQPGTTVNYQGRQR